MPNERNDVIVDWTEFGKWVAKEQLRLGYSDRELARRAGMSATHIGMIKKGTTGLGDTRFTALVQALGLTVEDAKKAMQLQRPDLTMEEREILESLHRVPSPERPRFMSIVKATEQAFSCAPNM